MVLGVLDATRRIPDVPWAVDGGRRRVRWMSDLRERSA